MSERIDPDSRARKVPRQVSDPLKTQSRRVVAGVPAGGSSISSAPRLTSPASVRQASSTEMGSPSIHAPGVPPNSLGRLVGAGPPAPRAPKSSMARWISPGATAVRRTLSWVLP